MFRYASLLFRFLLLSFAAGLGLCGSGCASIGAAGAASVLTLGVLIATSGPDADQNQIKAENSFKREIEAELRPLLPPTAHATTPDANRLSVTGSQGSIVSVRAVGDFAPESTRQFIAGARTLALRRALDMHVAIYTDRRTTEAAPEETSNQLTEFIRSHFGYERVEIRMLNPRSEVARKLGPFVPRSATHAKTIWGSFRSGEVYLEAANSRIVAGGDFSTTTAFEFITVAKLAFPEIAIAVYRDVTKTRDGWQLVATHEPTTRQSPGGSDPPEKQACNR